MSLKPTIKVSTVLGEISVGINNAKSIYFLNENIKVNGVDYWASGYMGLTDGKWKMLDTFSIRKINSVKHGDYSTSAKNKACELLTSAISYWLENGEQATTLLREAQEEYIQERRERLQSEIDDKQKEIDALKAKMNALN